jgi:hypothetical protein
MKPEDIAKCKVHIEGALQILEREADTQPEVHLLICLREVMEDIEWLELHEAQAGGNVVRLSDVRHLRAVGGACAAE